VMRTDEKSASIFWETRTEGCVAVGVTPEGGGAETNASGTATMTTVSNDYGVDIGLKMPDLAGTYFVNRVDVTGLALPKPTRR